MKRTNSGAASRWCGTCLGHRVLLLGSVGFRICKCLAERRWPECGCQTQHRTRLEKATARSIVWLFHCVFLSNSSGVLDFVVIVPSVASPLSVARCVADCDYDP